MVNFFELHLNSCYYLTAISSLNGSAKESRKEGKNLYRPVNFAQKNFSATLTGNLRNGSQGGLAKSA